MSEGAHLLVLGVYVPIPNTYVRQDDKYESYLLSAMLDCVNEKITSHADRKLIPADSMQKSTYNKGQESTRAIDEGVRWEHLTDPLS